MFNGAIAAIFVREQTERQFREPTRRQFREPTRRQFREQTGQFREQAGQFPQPAGQFAEERFRERPRLARVLPSGARPGRALHRRGQASRLARSPGV